MRISSFEEMLVEYGIAELDTDDNDNRKEMLLSYPYPVIVEGDFMEFDNLNEWIKTHIDPRPINWMFYKTGYDFGFAEYFFGDEFQAAAVANVIPHIYTVYSGSYPPNHTLKSNGFNEIIDYDPTDENAIVLKIAKD